MHKPTISMQLLHGYVARANMHATGLVAAFWLEIGVGQPQRITRIGADQGGGVDRVAKPVLGMKIRE